MMLIEEATVPDIALPVEAFKAHLRLGTGFAEGNVQDSVLRSFLRAAIAAIEARTGKALITRAFAVVLNAWPTAQGVTVPIAPVVSVQELALIDHAGDETVADVDTYWLAQDAHHPQLKPRGFALPQIPQAGSARVRFTAGYAAAFDGIPPDLAQAVFLLAAHYYEFRQETTLSEASMPFGVLSLIARYRALSLRGGRG